jgi:hypothetical protein
MLVEVLRVDDRIEGAGNWSPWKVRIVLILEELELCDIVENHVVPPIDVVLLAKFQKRNIKAKRNILDAIKDHIIPHVYGKDITFHMWNFLCGYYHIPKRTRRWCSRRS